MENVKVGNKVEINKKVVEHMWHSMCPKKATSEKPENCPESKLQSCGTSSDTKYWCAK